ncbi:MAG: dihydrofolate reductase, partial [Malacoplasma sp.]|nr:dihydrofolate reductase [Malacoplasma sp.]
YWNCEEEIYIIGGKKIYEFFIPFSQKILISKLYESYDCDVFMENKFDDFTLIEVKKFNFFTLEIYENKNFKKF